MRLRIPHGKEEECLIGIRKDDLLDIVGVTGEPGQRARSRSDRFDAPLPFSDISYQHRVSDGDEIGPASLPLEATLDRGEQLSTVGQLDGEELAVRTHHHARERPRRRSGTRFEVPSHRDLNVVRRFAAGSPATYCVRWNLVGTRGRKRSRERQGGAFRRPLYRSGDHRLALGADASLTEEPGAAVTAGTAGATLETAAVETAVAIDAVVAAKEAPPTAVHSASAAQAPPRAMLPPPRLPLIGWQTPPVQSRPPQHWDQPQPPPS